MTLGHEFGAGAACLKCKDKCEGFELHFWRFVFILTFTETQVNTKHQDKKTTDFLCPVCTGHQEQKLKAGQ